MHPLLLSKSWDIEDLYNLSKRISYSINTNLRGTSYILTDGWLWIAAYSGQYGTEKLQKRAQVGYTKSAPSTARQITTHSFVLWQTDKGLCQACSSYSLQRPEIFLFIGRDFKDIAVTLFPFSLSHTRTRTHTHTHTHTRARAHAHTYI